MAKKTKPKPQKSVTPKVYEGKTNSFFLESLASPDLLPLAVSLKKTINPN